MSLQAMADKLSTANGEMEKRGSVPKRKKRVPGEKQKDVSWLMEDEGAA
jgi:hypothetical protein